MTLTQISMHVSWSSVTRSDQITLTSSPQVIRYHRSGKRVSAYGITTCDRYWKCHRWNFHHRTEALAQNWSRPWMHTE